MAFVRVEGPLWISFTGRNNCNQHISLHPDGTLVSCMCGLHVHDCVMRPNILVFVKPLHVHVIF